MTETLLYIAGLGLFGMYGLVPLLVYSQNGQPERFRLDPIPKERVLEETEARFHALAQQIEANGFGYIAASAFPTSLSGLKTKQKTIPTPKRY